MQASRFLYKTLGFLLLFACLTITFQAAWAQQNHNRNTLQGIVIDASNGRSVGNTLVKIPSLNKETRTNEVGQFTFKGIDSLNEKNDEITFRVVHRAYKEFVKTINLKETDKIMLQLERKPRLQ